MSLTITPHDALFRAIVSSSRRAAALLRDYYPGTMPDLMDPDVLLILSKAVSWMGKVEDPMQCAFRGTAKNRANCHAHLQAF